MAERAARLPGIRFEAQPPAPAAILPRMDIAVFVGFAASGPLDIPVSVEDFAHFREIFGDDLPLAWDEQRGEMITAYLAPAVRAFFRNGGRRCWVVRVAGPACTNFFPIPGLLQIQPNGRLTPAYARARSAGSWADTWQVGAEVLSRSIQVVALTLEPLCVTLRLDSPDHLQPGDLLRLTLAQGNQLYQLMFAVSQWSQRASNGAALDEVQVSGEHVRWFRLPGLPSGVPVGRARLYSSSRLFKKGEQRHTTASVPSRLDWQPTRPIDLDLDLSPEYAPDPGTFIRIDFGSERLWLVVLSTATVLGGSPIGQAVRVTGAGLWEVSTPPMPAETETPLNWLRQAERLTLALTMIQAGQAEQQRHSSELGLAPEHPAFWGALPSDEQLFAGETSPIPTPRNHSYTRLWQAAAEPRFPLAGCRDWPRHTLRPTYPIPLPLSARPFLGAIRLSKTALERDGLAKFSGDLFLDPALKDTKVETLLTQADFLRYEQPLPRRLRGIHAALELEEATLIAVPDAGHLGWRRSKINPSVLPIETSEPAPPECVPPLLSLGEGGHFADREALVAPELQPIDAPDWPASYCLAWTAPPGPAVQYVLEEASQADFGDATAIYKGGSTHFEISGRSPGVYYYRVRAEELDNDKPRLVSGWSNGVGVPVGAVRPWVVNSVDPIAPDDLLSYREPTIPIDLLKLQHALLTLCAARSDLFAILSLPLHYREDEVLAHVRWLEKQFSFDLARTLSFGALYHPWLFVQAESGQSRLVLTPPDGVIAGLLARRTLARGAWVAPANELLHGVLALHPPLAAERRLELQEGRLNLIRREPAGFTTLCANTLARDKELRLINVRRLLILLRRLALREGAAFVFEPNSPALRRQVERVFETLLGEMFSLGAFSGTTPDKAYRVDVSNQLNTPTSSEQGRLITELRVAPSQPLSFLTVRLVQTGERTLQVQER